jgi:hypothetical protein
MYLVTITCLPADSSDGPQFVADTAGVADLAASKLAEIISEKLGTPPFLEKGWQHDQGPHYCDYTADGKDGSRVTISWFEATMNEWINATWWG